MIDWALRDVDQEVQERLDGPERIVFKDMQPTRPMPEEPPCGLSPWPC